MGTEETAKVDEAWVIKRMVGRDLYADPSRPPPRPDRILEVEGLSDGERFRDVAFHLLRRRDPGVLGACRRGPDRGLQDAVRDHRAEVPEGCASSGGTCG